MSNQQGAAEQLLEEALYLRPEERGAFGLSGIRFTSDSFWPSG